MEKYQFLQDTDQEIIVDLKKNAKKSDSVYAFSLKNATLDLHLRCYEEWIRAQIFIFIPSFSPNIEWYNRWYESKVIVKADISSPDVYLNIHCISILSLNSSVNVQGEINISAGLKDVETHLMEEVVLLEWAKYTQLKPILNVASPSVKASHWAKIHRINREHLFYLESKGFAWQNALDLILQWYKQHIFDHFSDSDKIKSSRPSSRTDCPVIDTDNLVSRF